MQKRISGPVQELDKAISLVRVEPFDFCTHRWFGRFLHQLRFRSLWRSFRIERRWPELVILSEPPFTLTKISTSFQDKFLNRL
jgi:hypothetical protein